MKLKFNLACLFAAALLFFTSCKKETAQLLPPQADAGNSQVVQLPAASVQLTGTGTASNPPIAGYLWSLVSGPNIPAIVSESSATTAIGNLVPGTYIFQFAVIDNAGLTGIDTVSVVVNAPLQQTITIQPSNNPNEGHVDSYNVAGGGGDTELQMGSWTIFGNATNWRSYLKFDQSALPAGATIVSATLYLYAMPTPHSANTSNAMNGTANAIYIERITGGWTAASLNFSSLPPTTATNRASAPQTSSAFENATINVTAMVQDMQTTGNYGFGFKLQNETIYNFRAYASSFYSDASLHPKLVITYQ